MAMNDNEYDETAKLVADAVAQERAAVVAWLRSQAESTNYRPRTCPLADAIERGEHRREEER
jgi:hypothetical protein